MAVDYSRGWQHDYLWILVLSWFGSGFMAFGLGSNDCANSYGTSVGSGVLKLWQAYALATVFEILGAALLGYKVTDTIRKLIVDLKVYDVFALQQKNGSEICEISSCGTFSNQTIAECPALENNSVWSTLNSSSFDCAHYSSAEFMLGEFCALLAASIWLIAATWFKAPVSTTHSAVGATIGFSLVLKGNRGVSWSHLLWEKPMIFPSMIISPVLSGIVAVILYVIVRFLAFNRKNPFKASLQMLPLFYFVTFTINTFAIIYQGSKYLHFNKLNAWQVLLIAVGVGTIAGLIAQFFLRPRVKSRVLERNRVDPIADSTGLKLNSSDAKIAVIGSKDDSVVETGSHGKHGSWSPNENLSNGVDPKTFSDRLALLKDASYEDPMATQVFSALQIMSAAFMSFAHGSNDTANAAAGLVAIWLTYKHDNAMTDSYSNEVEWLNVFGGVMMVVGLWILGHKVIARVGKEITVITPASGFCMELATGFTVLFASKLGIPVSTTHCLVGSVMCVGLYRFHKVDLKIFLSIITAWVVTLPVAGFMAAFFTWALNHAI